MGTYIGIEVGVTDFGNLTGGSSVTPGAAFFSLFEQTHFTEKISGVEIGDNNFLAIIVFENDRNRTLDYVIQRIALVTFIDDSRAIRITFAMAMRQEVIQILYMW